MMDGQRDSGSLVRYGLVIGTWGVMDNKCLLCKSCPREGDCVLLLPSTCGVIEIHLRATSGKQT